MSGRGLGTAGTRFAVRVQAILDGLLAETGASRTTLRLDEPTLGFAMVEVVAEALAPGERSMRGEGTINHRAAATGLWLEEHRRLLVQNDLARTGFPAPAGLTGTFGVKAQMLAPVQREGRLEGWVSVHEARSARAWTEADRAAATRAASAVETLLASG